MDCVEILHTVVHSSTIIWNFILKSPLCDDNPHENISKIYKEEFSRLMQETRLSEKQSSESLSVAAAAAGLPFFPGLGPGGFFQRGAPPTDFQV